MKRIVAVFIAILLLIGILIVNAAEKSIVKIPDPQEHRITLTDGLNEVRALDAATANDGAHAQKLRAFHRRPVSKSPYRQHLQGSDHYEF